MRTLLRNAWQVGLLLITALSVSAFHTDDRERLAEAIALATEGEYEQSLDVFEGLLRESPDDPRLNYYVGLCHFYLKDMDKAESFLKSAVEKKAPFPQAYYWLARLLIEQEKEEKACETVRLGLEYFPENVDLLRLSRRIE